VRCPAAILSQQLPRVASLDSTRARDLLCSGDAFVAPAEGLFGTQMLRWDFRFLEEHLPSHEKYGVMLDDGEGSRKIVMSHTARNGKRQVGEDGCSNATREDEEELFSASDQTKMTFRQFLDDADRYRRSGGQGKLPYFGAHLLWRLKESDNGYLGKIDQDMADDLFKVNFAMIKEWQESNLIPLVQRFYLWCGIGGTLYHCHYDLQPNLFVQLTGRKRFLIFPPEDWPHLYPFPVHHDLDRRSKVDFDAPDNDMHPLWQGAHGHLVELGPGDALYIPPYWWHQVQSLTPETTSLAVWFFETFPLSAGVKYGVGPRADDVVLMRQLEEFIGKQFPDVPGEEETSDPRPVKAQQVADFVRWLRPRLDPAESGSETSPPPPPELRLPAEDIEAQLYKILKDSGKLKTDKQAQAKLCAFLRGRY